MSDQPFEELPDPDGLWDPDAEGQDAAAPPAWIWSAMEPAERRARLRELATWVDWLTTTFELHNTIPRCWYRHQPVVEHLTALYTGWVRTYCGTDPGRDLAEADWISTLHAFTPRLQVHACATGTHQAPPPTRPYTGAEDAFEEYLATADATTAPAAHPAQAQALRIAAEPLL